jgi:hypothetical protein
MSSGGNKKKEQRLVMMIDKSSPAILKKMLRSMNENDLSNLKNLCEKHYRPDLIGKMDECIVPLKRGMTYDRRDS